MNKIKPQRPDWGPRRNIPDHNQTSPAGTIALAIIAGSIILIGGWIGYQEYKEWRNEQRAIQLINQFAKEAQDLTEQANRDAARYKAEREEKALKRKLSTEKGIAQIRDEQLAKAKAKERMEECRYWEQKLQKSNTQGNRKMVKTWCY